ncbi:hypothetical protein HAX54_025218 [Datura stramonium]|uniref:Thioesterase domain-containing protein n=1 Tax=Datura stramonium TaxID=4076 RepID=A0ABS8S604_DATST|nr:hypothetical protein [Datura stramonium]
MEKAKAFLELTQGESDPVSSLAFPPHRLGTECSFYEYYALRGIRVDRIEPGQVFCTFRVPPRLTDRQGKLASGAIANLVDEVGGAVVYVEGLPMNVSVDMSISFLSSAKADDELEIIGRVLGQKGGYSGTSVLVKNKTTGELIAEGRHSLFDFVDNGCFHNFIRGTDIEDSRPPGIRVDRVEPGLVFCTFKVPPRLTDRAGKLAPGAIANIVDAVGAGAVNVGGHPLNVSVDMSISFLSSAKVDDELEIIGQVLGKKGGYSGTSVLVKNKATGELIAEGRHSLFAILVCLSHRADDGL